MTASTAKNDIGQSEAFEVKSQDRLAVHEPKRFENIDALRAIFIIMVLLFHYLLRWEPPLHVKSSTQLDYVYSPLFEFGAFGVQFFFIISGLVIAMTVERCHSVKEFLFKRFSRIYPAFIVSVLFTFALANFTGHDKFDLKDIISNLVFLPSLFPGHPDFRYIDGVYWSLAVEIKFYTFIAIFFLILKRNYWLGLVGLAIFVSLADVTGWVKYGILDRIFLVKYLSFLLFGMFLYAIHFDRNIKKAVMLLVPAVGLYLLQMQHFMLYGGNWIGPALFLSVGSVLVGYIAILAPSVRFAPLLYIGRISYSLYLLHEIFGVILIAWLKSLGAPDFIAVASALAGAFGLASLSFHYIEQPSQRWLRQLPALRTARKWQTDARQM